MNRVPLMMVLFLLCFIAVAEGAEWVLYGRGSSGVSYYDSESITHPSEDIVGVWEKRIYSDEAIESIGQDFGVPDISESKGLSEFNCRTRERRIVRGWFYNSPMEEVRHTGHMPVGWLQIIPERNAENLYKIVCEKVTVRLPHILP